MGNFHKGEPKWVARFFVRARVTDDSFRTPNRRQLSGAALGFIGPGALERAAAAAQPARNSTICPLSPEFGAKGDGIADDTAAVRMALQVADANNAPVDLAGGHYNLKYWTSYAWANESLFFRGAGTLAASLRLPPNCYFLQMSRALKSACLSDFTCSGGKGFLNSKFGGTNVSYHKVFERVLFHAYTECAVQTNGRDEPYWLFRECAFLAADSQNTIGLAIGSGCDGSAVLFCTFLRNRIDIKLRQAGIFTNVVGTDFTRADSGKDTAPRIRIWYVPWSTPTNAGDGARVSANKFGNENQQIFDYDIVYADEGLGTCNGDTMPDLSRPSSGYVAGHTYSENKFSGANAMRRPPVTSFTALVRGLQATDNLFVGTNPSTVLDFALSKDSLGIARGKDTNKLTPNRYSSDWMF